MFCSACERIIDQDTKLVCKICQLTFHYACLNITDEDYLLHKHTYEKKWFCPSCENITRRRKNDDTPVRCRTPHSLNDITLPTNKVLSVNVKECTNKNMTTDVPPSLNTKSNTQSSSSEKNQVTLENISTLLDKKLKENNATIFTNLKDFIQSEINKAITKIQHENTQNTEKIQDQQRQQNNEILTINNKIQTLETERKRLSQELSQLRVQLQNEVTQKSKPIEENTKKIVIHGLIEYYQETENDLLNRVTNMFNDVLQVDLYDYIESIYRIGRNNSKRPLVVEFLSKRMTNYILNNVSYFNNTGVTVSEYLTEQSLKEKREMRVQLRIAREKGKYAIIKNNKLIIDGKIIGPPFEKLSINNERINSPVYSPTANISQPQALINEENLPHRINSSQGISPHNNTFRSLRNA